MFQLLAKTFITPEMKEFISSNKEAFEFVKKLMNEKAEHLRNMNIFFDDYQQAEAILLKAKKAMESLSFPWKETQLEVYLGLISCEKGDYQPVLDLLRKKEELISRYGNPRDKGLIYYLMAVIKYQLLVGDLKESGFEELLTRDFDYYYDTAKSHLNFYRDRHQLKELENLRLRLSQ